MVTPPVPERQQAGLARDDGSPQPAVDVGLGKEVLAPIALRIGVEQDETVMVYDGELAIDLLADGAAGIRQALDQQSLSRSR